MAEAFYEPTPATDGATMNPVPGAVFQVFEISDTTFSTPLSLRVGSGNPTTTVAASETLATLPGVYVTSDNYEHHWKSGSFVWRRDSIDGAKQAVEAAKIAASNSAAAATEVQSLAESGALNGEPGAAGPQGERGLPGLNAVENDVAFAAAVKSSGTATNAALTGAVAPRTNGIVIRNPDKLDRWAVALQDTTTSPAVLTVVGDSISWGVGSDGVADESNVNRLAVYEQAAWPVVLGKLLDRAHNVRPVRGWMGISDPVWGYATITGGARVASIGPFGQWADNKRGGLKLAGNGQNVVIPASKTGRFTALDIFWWGSDAGVSIAGSPQVLIDGVEKAAQSAPSTSLPGNLNKLSITGLTDATHEIKLVGPSQSETYLAGLVVHNNAGVVVNRIAIPGATSTDATGGTQTGAGKQRNIDSAVLKGYSDLVVLMLGTNDNGAQIPLTTYKANLQALIDSAVAGGACVLLLGAPPSWSGETVTITETQYRTAMSELSDSNAHVAYADTRPLFGKRDGASADLFPTAGTVHPSRKGHELIAGEVFRSLPLAKI